MSGTSLDGIDVAWLETDGEGDVQRGPSRTYAYDGGQRDFLRRALADAAAVVVRTERPGCLAEAEGKLTAWHAEAVFSFCRETGRDLARADVIGFHGQTVIHRPERRLTLQLGDGTELARRTGRPVVYDMRAADVAAGGQGAPLVPVYHRALARDLEKPMAFLNIGGVANVTWIGPDGTLLAFDTGPGNALIDDWMVSAGGVPHDAGGRLALLGRADPASVAQFLGDEFFERPPPKSLDRNAFARVDLTGMPPEDGAATLTAVTVGAVAASGRWFPGQPRSWIVCGGGRRNNAILAGLRQNLPGVLTAEEAGFDGDAMEAEAWAYLAVRALKGLALTFPGTTGAANPLTGGVIVRP